MQDDTNTAQATAEPTGADEAKVEEATLSLGSNPISQQDNTSTAPVAIDSTVDTSKPEDIPKQEDAKSSTPAPAISSDLQAIRTDALKDLVPIVNELDQEPEDKFRTLMMIIQSSDDQKLIKDAYETANKITDKKLKAEALLSIIDEINYFSGKESGSGEA